MWGVRRLFLIRDRKSSPACGFPRGANGLDPEEGGAEGSFDVIVILDARYPQKST